MRFNYAVALLMTGPSVVLSFLIPPFLYLEPNSTQAIEISANKLLPYGWKITRDETSPSTSAHLSHVYARQLPDEDIGKRYTPDDAEFLSALTKALVNGVWAFRFDHESFWTLHVSKAIIKHHYDEIYTMAQEKLVLKREKELKSQRKKAKKAEKKRIKAEKNAVKKGMKKAQSAAERRHDEKKLAHLKVVENLYEQEEEHNKTLEKAEKKRVKEDAKVAKKAGKKVLLAQLLQEKVNVKMDKKEIDRSERAYFNGGGPTIFEDDFTY